MENKVYFYTFAFVVFVLGLGTLFLANIKYKNSKKEGDLNV